MDSTGVPQKINRHVYKAVNHLGRDASNFLNIYNYVKVCTRNLKPVPHLKATVEKSLNNLKAIGIVKSNSRQRYKLKGKNPHAKDNKFTEDNSRENLSPQTRKKRRPVDTDEENENEVENVPKRFKASSKNFSRTRLQAKKLPKHRRYNLRVRRSRNSVKARVSTKAERSKASIIYKKNNNVTSNADLIQTPGSNENDNELEQKQSKEDYEFKTEEDVTNVKNIENNSKVKETESIVSKPTASHHSAEYEHGNNGVEDEQVANLNEINNEQNEETIRELGRIRGYNYDYLN